MVEYEGGSETRSSLLPRLQNAAPALLGTSEVGSAYNGQRPAHLVTAKDTHITKLLHKPRQKYHSRDRETFLEVFLAG